MTAAPLADAHRWPMRRGAVVLFVADMSCAYPSVMFAWLAVQGGASVGYSLHSAGLVPDADPACFPACVVQAPACVRAAELHGSAHHDIERDVHQVSPYRRRRSVRRARKSISTLLCPTHNECAQVRECREDQVVPTKDLRVQPREVCRAAHNVRSLCPPRHPSCAPGLLGILSSGSGRKRGQG